MNVCRVNDEDSDNRYLYGTHHLQVCIAITGGSSVLDQ